jgi:hypothetical protein
LPIYLVFIVRAGAPGHEQVKWSCRSRDPDFFLSQVPKLSDVGALFRGQVGFSQPHKRPAAVMMK